MLRPSAADLPPLGLVGLRALGGEEPRHEGRADDAAGTTDQLDHVVRDVARHVAERAAFEWEKTRRLRDLDRLPHRVLGHVRQVDEHAEAVQLATTSSPNVVRPRGPFAGP